MPDVTTSIVIPSRNCNWLAKTIEDIFKKASGSVQIVALLDNFWPDPIPKDNPNLIMVHKGSVGGMRDSINRGVQLAHGKFIMKTDDHCSFSEGFDQVLADACGNEDLCVPSRYSLDVEKWERKDRPPVQYNFLTFPYVDDDQFGTGLHGKKWMGATNGPNGYYEPENKFKDKRVDEIITFQGSCWFMTKQKFIDIDMLDTKYSSFFQEAQELGLKTWLSSGRCLCVKDAFYAHWHKSDSKDANFGLSYREKKDAERLHAWLWMTDRWPKRQKSIKYLIEKFWPLPGWPENWEEETEKYYREHPEVCQNFRVVDEKGHDGLKWQS